MRINGSDSCSDSVVHFSTEAPTLQFVRLLMKFRPFHSTAAAAVPGCGTCVAVFFQRVQPRCYDQLLGDHRMGDQLVGDQPVLKNTPFSDGFGDDRMHASNP